MSNVLITGCSTGIGFATAELLARKGHTVYATMRHPQGAPALAQLAERDNLPITILPLDVDSDESVKTAIAQVLAQAGHLDVLVNNAGIAPLSVVEETPLEIYQRVMQTNYFGTLRCIQAVLPSMRERRSGLIINISSITGKVYAPYFGAYSATKAAVEALSETLAGEVEPLGIRVAVVIPGIIYTSIMDKLEQVAPDTFYPNLARMRALLLSSKENNIPVSVVGDTIQEIISGQRTGFRHVASPDAALFLGYRASLSDEDWIASASIDEETWIAGMAQMGNNVRPYLKAPVNSPVLS
ncbi:MAG: short-chain dehydrogenase [Adhaeribacter sp.]|jgi:NAD(P)-dependent dehydrogenase (short-subunit alcohol dehydrogenase family)|nr:short-chain dehydrogenase [Adhaeribacter sp.]